MAHRITPILSAAVMACAVLQTAGAQPADAEMVASIRAEELRHSAASELFFTLTDTLGARLSGSPSYDKAARWASSGFVSGAWQTRTWNPFVWAALGRLRNSRRR
jgi:hypothetical protein